MRVRPLPEKFFLWAGFAFLFSFFSPYLQAQPSEAGQKASSEVFSLYHMADILYSDQSFFTATRSLKPIREVTDNVTVITREELDRWPVADLDEALSLVNGIVVQDDGLVGQTATAQLYGSKPREVRVMVDGITFNATTTGGIADLSQIPLDFVEKIEIIKGASSSVWGSALGGVINIITRPVGENWIPKGSLSSSLGEFGTQRQRGEMWGGLGPLHYYGFGSYVETGGFRPNSDELEQRGFFKAEIPFSEGFTLKGSFGYSGSKISEFDLPDLSVTAKRKVFSRYGSLGLTFVRSGNFNSDLFYKLSERNFRRDTRILPLRTFFQLSKARSVIHEISFKNVWEVTDSQTLVFGSDIGVDVYRDAVFRATTTPANVNKEDTRHAYYANYQLSWWRFNVTAGSRVDFTRSYGTNFSPSAGWVFRLPFRNLLFRANVSRAFNTPSLVDRFLSSGTTIANPDLRAERAIVYNTGFELDPFSFLHAKGVFFQTFLEDSIQTLRRSDGLRQAVNIARERRTGFETEAKAGPWRGFSTSYGMTYVKAIDPATGPIQSRPRFTQDIKLNYGKKFRGMDFNFHLAGRYTDLVKYKDFTDVIDQVFIFDSKLVLTFPKILYGNFSLFLEGENLLNEDFSFDGGRDPYPQRNFEVGLKYQF